MAEKDSDQNIEKKQREFGSSESEIRPSDTEGDITRSGLGERQSPSTMPPSAIALIGKVVDRNTERPQKDLKVALYRVGKDERSICLASDFTNFRGAFFLQGLDYEVRSDADAEKPFQLRILDNETILYETEIQLLPGQSKRVVLRIAAPDRPLVESPNLKQYVKDLKTAVTDDTLNSLASRRIETLADLRANGGLVQIEDLDLPGDDETLRTLEAHANLSLLSDDAQRNAALIEKGYTSIAAIARAPRIDFIRSLRNELSVEEAASLHVRAEAQVAVINNLVTGLRVNAASSTRTTAEGEAVDDCAQDQSALSPLAYFADLTDYSLKHLQSSDPQYAELTLDLLANLFYQPFGEFPISSTWVNREVRQIRIVTEVLRRYVGYYVGNLCPLNRDSFETGVANYLKTAYDTILKSIGTSFSELLRLRAAKDEERAALGDRLGIESTHLEELSKAALYPRYLADAFLDITFGLRDPKYDPLSTGFKLSDSHEQVRRWMLDGVYWARNTDADGRIWGSVERTNDGLVQVQLYRDSGREWLIASGESPVSSPRLKIILNEENNSGLSGRIDFRYRRSPSTFSLALIPSFLTWKFAYLRGLWVQQDWPDDLYDQARLPIVDPDLIGPNDLRNPQPGNAAFDLWKPRRDEITQILVDLRNDRLSQGFTQILKQVLGDPLPDLDGLLANLRDGTAIEWTKRTIENLNLTVESFTRLMEIKAMDEDPGAVVSESEWEEAEAILAQAEKQKSFPKWRNDERDAELVLGPKHFWIALDEPLLPQWLASDERRRAWQQALKSRSRPPIIDPDLIDESELVSRFEDPLHGSFARRLWKERRDWLEATREGIETNYGVDFDRILVKIVGAKSPDELEELTSAQGNGESISDRLVQLGLSFNAFQYLLHFQRLLKGHSPLGTDDWNNVYDILVQVLKQQEFATWREAERTKQIIVSPDFFRSTDRTLEDTFRSNPTRRREWEELLSSRVAQEQSIIDGLLDALGAAEDAALPGLCDELLKATSLKWGRYGTSDGEFKYPCSIAVSASGAIYVVEFNSSRVQKFHTDGQFVASWGKPGSDEGEPGSDDVQFRLPWGIAVDPVGNVYVADRGNQRIQKLDGDGRLLEWDGEVSGDNKIYTPNGVAIGADGAVFVADDFKHRILKFDAEGNFITEWGSEGSGDDQFDSPTDLTIDAGGHVYVADTNNRRIKIYDADGNFIETWNPQNKPYGVAVDKNGELYVSDQSSCYIKKFDSTGAFVASWGGEGPGDGQFRGSLGIDIDAAGNIFVSDWGNHRIQKFCTGQVDLKTQWVADNLLIDPKVAPCRKTTRLSQAIETFQALVRATRQRKLEVANLFFEEFEQFEEEWVWMGAYGNWRVAMFVFLYPEVALLPTLRPGERQTDEFQEISSLLRNQGRITPAIINSALARYERYINDVRTLRIEAVASYSFTDFLLAYAPDTQSIYWRTIDHYEHSSLKLSGANYWRRVPGSFDLKTNQGKVIKIIGAKGVQVRPYIFVIAVVREEIEGQPQNTRRMFRYSIQGRRWDEEFEGGIEFTDDFRCRDVSLFTEIQVHQGNWRDYWVGRKLEMLCDHGGLQIADIDFQGRAVETYNVPEAGGTVLVMYNRVIVRSGDQIRLDRLRINEDWYNYDSPPELIHSINLSSYYFVGIYSVVESLGSYRTKDYFHVLYRSGEGVKYDVIELTENDSTVVAQGLRADFLSGPTAKVVYGHGFVGGSDQRLYHIVYWQADDRFFKSRFVSEKTGQPYQLTEQSEDREILVPHLVGEVALTEDLTSAELQERRARAEDECNANAAGRETNWVYLEEIYYSVPVLAALKLAAAQYHRNALNWLRGVYDYTASLDRRKIYPPLDWEYEEDVGVPAEVERPSGWLSDPLNPHAIARLRAGAHSRYTLLSVVRCMLDYADAEFTRDTAESLPRAGELYRTALELLNAPDFEPLPSTKLEDLESLGLLGVQRYETFEESLSRSKAAMERAQTALMSRATVQTAASAAAERAERVLEANITRDGGAALRNLTAESSALPLAAELLPGLQEEGEVPLSLPEVLDLRENGEAPTPEVEAPALEEVTLARQTPSASSIEYTSSALPIGNHVYCIPESTLPLVLRLRAEINLHKLRNCRNIAGMQRDIEPYSTEVDLENMGPVLGAVFSAAGEALAGTIAIRPTQYRYQTLISRGKELVNIAQQMEAAFLSALEKRDAAAYSELKARQDVQLTRAGVRLQDLRLRGAEDGVALAELQQQRAQLQVDTYQEWIDAGLNQYEQAMLDSYQTAGVARAMQAQYNTEIAIAQAFTTAATASGFGAAAAFGAAGLVTGAALKGKFEAQTAIMAETQAQIASVWASFERRKQEWELHRALAQQDTLIGNQQIRLAEDQVRVSRQERNIASFQSEHAQTVADFMINKFLNAELYDWMSGILEGVYSYFLQQATAVARLAENQLAFERHQIPAGIIQADYWTASSEDQLGGGEESEDRRGLTGSARLLRDLYQLDQYRFDTEKLKLQLTKTISLSQLAPTELQRFRETGVVIFATPMELFDRDFPGHYLRLIKRVRVSVVALIPPAAGIHATLVSPGVSRVVVGGQVFRTMTVRRDPEQIALTSPQSSAGLFELTPQTQEMLLPFEGNGVDTLWELRMPKASNQFDYNTIADILLTIEYMALDSDVYRQQVLEELDGSLSFDRAFSFQQQFPDQWYQLHNPSYEAGPLAVSFETSRADFPPNVDNLRIDHLTLYFSRKDSDEVEVAHLNFREGESGPPLGGSATSVDGLISTRKLNAGSWLPMIGRPPIGKWELALPRAKMLPRFEEDQIEDILFVITCAGDSAAWPQ